MFGRSISDLLKSSKLGKVIVGMDPTGHYWLSLARWLLDKEIEAVLVNPHVRRLVIAKICAGKFVGVIFKKINVQSRRKATQRNEPA